VERFNQEVPGNSYLRLTCCSKAWFTQRHKWPFQYTPYKSSRFCWNSTYVTATENCQRIQVLSRAYW
jgi:hypothetical protein